MVGDHHVDERLVERVGVLEIAHVHRHAHLVHGQAERVGIAHHELVVLMTAGERLDIQPLADCGQFTDLGVLVLDDAPGQGLDPPMVGVHAGHLGHLDRHLMVGDHLANEGAIGRGCLGLRGCRRRDGERDGRQRDAARDTTMHH
jgi:hypothetical protein